jgi:hypothetical protein
MESTKTIEDIGDEQQDSEENGRLMSHIQSIEAELLATRDMYASVCQTLVDAKTETAHMASELVLAAEREDESREYVEELQSQLASVLDADGASMASSALQSKRTDLLQEGNEASMNGRKQSRHQEEGDDDSLSSSVMSDYYESRGNDVDPRFHRKW